MKWSIVGTGKQSGLYIIDNFLTPNECALLIRRAQKYGYVEPWYTFKKGTETLSNKVLFRYEHCDTNKTILEINKRSSHLTGLPMDHAEPLTAWR